MQESKAGIEEIQLKVGSEDQPEIFGKQPSTIPKKGPMVNSSRESRVEAKSKSSAKVADR